MFNIDFSKDEEETNSKAKQLLILCKIIEKESKK